MKRSLMIICLLAAAFAVSCKDHDDVVFGDYFVSIKDEAGMSAGIVSQTSNNFVTTYYVYMTAPLSDHDISVAYDVEVGAGLQEGVDFRIQSTTVSPLVFAPGTDRMPIRIVWLRHALDPDADNTVTLRLTSCSEGYGIGYPGPQRKFSTYTITKQ